MTSLAYRSVPNLPPLDPALEAMLAQQISRGERLLWRGTPSRRALRRSVIPLLFFATVWTTFSVLWVAGAATASFAFASFGLPFVAIGVFLFAHATRPLREADRTVYAVTDRRALVVANGAAKAYTRAMMTSFAISAPDRDGRRDVVFLDRETNDTRTTAGFYGIEDAKEVERILREEMLS
jgi:hypothetical protein